MKRHWRKSVIVFAVVLVSSFASAAPIVVSGQVVDQAGKPLPWADVWLQGLNNNSRAPITSLIADSEGRFAFTRIELPPQTGAADNRVRLVAYSQGLAVAWVNIGPNSEALTVTCPQPAMIVGRVVGADGNGLEAMIRCQSIAAPDDGGVLWLDNTRFSVRCKPSGEFLLPFVAQGRTASVQVYCPGWADGAATLGAAPWLVTLQHGGTLDLQLTCTDEPKTVQSVNVWYNSGDQNRTNGTGRTDANGRVVVPNLPPGKYRLSLDLPPTGHWGADIPEVSVMPDKTTRQEVALLRLVQVTGRVVDAETGEGVAAADVAVVGAGRTPQTRTDEQGRYTLSLLPGRLNLRVWPPPRDRYIPGNTIATVPPTGGALPDITVAKSLAAKGIVVDQGGKPVPGAEVYTSWTAYSGEPAAKADGDGRFTLSSLPPGQEMTLYAVAPNAVSKETVKLSTATPLPELKLIVVPARPVTVQVRIVDQDAKPVSGAAVTATWTRFTWPRELQIGTTDAQGVCRSGPLTPLGSYQLRAAAAGCDAVGTSTWTVIPGDSYDYGTLTMPRAVGTLVGKVVDQQGKPLAAITVFSTGSSPYRVESVTDAQGIFRLAGLFPGHALVFADAAGYQFTGAGGDTGTDTTVVTLTPRPRVDALAPIPAPETGIPSAQAEAAHQYIKLALTVATGESRKWLIGQLAIVDLEEAQRLAEAEGGDTPDYIARRMGKALISTDTEAALKWIGQVGKPDDAVRLQVAAAVSLATSGSPNAIAQLNAAIPAVQTLSDAQAQAIYLARLGQAALPLDRALGEATIRQAQKVAAVLSRESKNGHTRQNVAKALALIDVDAALEMLQGVAAPPNCWHGYFQSGLDEAIAAADPAAGEVQLAHYSPEEQTNQAMRMACQMARKDPPRALKIIRAMREEPYYTLNRSKAYGFATVAQAVRESDPPLSLKLFNEAVAMASEPQSVTIRPGVVSDRRATLFAVLSLIGHDVGYPLREELAWRAAALLGVDPAPGARHDAGTVLGLLTLAAPSIAGDLALVQLPRSLDQTETVNHLRSSVMKALAVARPERAPGLVGPPRSKPGTRQADSEIWVYNNVAVFLLTPPDRRAAQSLRNFSIPYVPPDEDWW